ncbi:MAG TPA: RagB/SusD family nutrient uptake outer membrane protein [Paludibacter sp.]|nr:RagB/SusD family nutrient uptake outer membrane protein [Paludibacter sp.]
MKNKKILFLLISVVFFSCQDYLDVPPLNVLSDDQVFSSESGITAYMATLYNDLPIEDFRFGKGGFNQTGPGGARLPHVSGEAMRDGANDIINMGDGTWWPLWDYGKIRRVTYFIETLPRYKSNFPDEKYNAWLGEAYFIRAYCYFAMVKRYGGVPIVKTVLQYNPDDLNSLRIPRGQEKDCYDFIGEDLDKAAQLLPRSETILGQGRATAYAAFTLKSRAMVYAGCIAKYGTLDAEHCIGIDAQYADAYFQKAYNAADSVVASGKFSLYRKNSDLQKNYAELFLAQSSPENIFVKYFQRTVNAHGWDVYFIPFQYRGSGYSSGMNPTLEFAEKFEHLDGTPADFSTRIQGTRFVNPADLFKDLDARFWGSIIYPNSIFKGDTCSFQKGLILEDGSKYETATSYDQLYTSTVTGLKYHVVGKSGVGSYSGNTTGFCIRKYMNDSYQQAEIKENYSEQHWIDMRYAEVYLNGAEAAVELGTNQDQTQLSTALTWINDLRSRAGLKALELPELTRDKVRNERRIELAFENQAYWDLRRWRIADKEINGKKFTALYPYFDIKNNNYKFETKAVNSYTYTFSTKMYYEMIPAGEISKNKNLVQNPQYN